MSTHTTDWNGLQLENGRYVIGATLGAGGMGQVYHARDTKLDIDVVLKVPHRELLHNPQATARFRREIRAALDLSHSHIVKVLDIGDHDGLPYFVLPFLAGGSLRDRMLRDAEGNWLPNPPKGLPAWLPAVAGALDFMHRQGYVHRDVKPHNILFDAAGQAYLGDFGLAKALTGGSAEPAVTHTGQVLGSLAYLAPELCQEKPDCDGRVDQYALAITLYEYLCGKLPFEGPPAVVLALHLTQLPPAPRTWVPNLPAAVEAALLQGLAKEPNERFAHCSALARAVLTGFRAGLPMPGAAVALGRGKKAPATVKGSAAPPSWTMLTCPSCRYEFPFSGPGGSSKVACPACQTEFPLPGGPARPSAGRWSPATETQVANAALQKTDATARQRPQPVAAVNKVEEPAAPARAALARATGSGEVLHRVHPKPLLALLLLPVLGVLLMCGMAAGLGGWWLLRSGWLKGGGTDRAGTGPAQPRLNLTLPDLVTLKPGEQRRVAMVISRQGWEGPVSVRAAELPGRVAVPAVTVAANENAAELELTVAPDAGEEESVVKVTASLGAHEVAVPLRVRIEKAGLLQVQPLDEQSLTVGGTVRVPIRLQRNNRQGAVKISVEGLPTGVNASPVTIPASMDQTEVVLTAAQEAGEGRTRVKVLAELGALRAEGTLLLVVARPVRLRLVSVPDLTLTAGESKLLSVRVERHGVAGPIKLQLEDLPSGVEAAPALVAVDSDTGQLGLTTQANAAAGSRSVRLTAVAAEARAETSFRLSVRRPLLEKLVTNSLDMKLVLISAGKFAQGTSDPDSLRLQVVDKTLANEAPQREVEITRPFYLGAYEVTQEEYAKLMGSSTSWFAPKGKGKVTTLNTNRFPVENVTWANAREFCQRLSDLPEERKAGRVYRLPTEAEWEYACRGGNNATPFGLADGVALSAKEANFDGRSPFGGAPQGIMLARTTTVGSYKPNGFGLYDMHGNVSEWCADWFGPYSKESQKDPVGLSSAAYRVLRGGSWRHEGIYCRSAARNFLDPNLYFNFLGFRVACVANPKAP